MPRVWPYPGISNGAFVMTHSADAGVELGTFMLEWESEAGLPSTVFVRADDADDIPDDLGRDIALLTMPPDIPATPTREIGLFGLAPMRQLTSYEAQLRAMRDAGGIGGDTLTVRMYQNLWAPDYGESFGVLAGLGVAIDSSYGPAVSPTEPEATAGYSFGTGLPFRPVDRNGLLLPLLEIPTVINDGESLEPGWVDSVLDRAAGVYNELVVADWRTGTMHETPRADVISSWRDSYDRAAQRGLWVTDLTTFARFWELRRDVTLRSEFSPADRRLTIQADTDAMESRGEQIVPSVAFEARYQGSPVERVTRNGSDVPFVDLGRSADGVFQIFALPPGSNRIEVTYQGEIRFDGP